MKIEETVLKGCFLITPTVFEDNRGYFYESYKENYFREIIGVPIVFVQENQSKSDFGVIRGLHLQLGNDNMQAKLVRAIQGIILDVAVDLRPESPSFGEYVACILSEENRQQLFVPRGFAHGISILSKTATIHYKTDNYYAPESESGIVYNDQDLNIDWQIPLKDIRTSDKDLLLPTLKEFSKKYV